MFTGLVEEVGQIRRIGRKGEAMVLNIGASAIMDDLKIGDSVAVNGVCLTATTLEGGGFTADVMPETYRHTNLSQLQSGSKVNLERAMQSGGRFGGHIVQGHVDGTGVIGSITRDQNAIVFEIKPDDHQLFKYLIPKGSVTLDGISLTVVHTSDTAFTVSIIPHTIGETVLNVKRQGIPLISNAIFWANMWIICSSMGEDIGRRVLASRAVSVKIFSPITDLHK